MTHDRFCRAETETGRGARDQTAQCAPRRVGLSSVVKRHGYDIVDEIAPEPKDLVIYKLKPSGFFATPMTGYLTQLNCDSVIVTGTTTSGCVRATVLDAFSYNYRVALVEDGCFDRSEASHAVTLCDMNAKYADVVRTSEVLAYIETLNEGMFNLPTGVPAS